MDTPRASAMSNYHFWAGRELNDFRNGRPDRHTSQLIQIQFAKALSECDTNSVHADELEALRAMHGDPFVSEWARERYGSTGSEKSSMRPANYPKLPSMYKEKEVLFVISRMTYTLKDSRPVISETHFLVLCPDGDQWCDSFTLASKFKGGDVALLKTSTLNCQAGLSGQNFIYTALRIGKDIL